MTGTTSNHLDTALRQLHLHLCAKPGGHMNLSHALVSETKGATRNRAIERETLCV